jgi:aryl-alcohol dehydrogenase-like predicted oxidoreductase
MRYRELGGMSVSVVGMGCNQLGVSCDSDGAVALVHEAVAAGVNYFDVADEYGRRYWDPTDPTWGLAEECLGRALRGGRDDVVIATKFGVRPPTRPELGGASAGWITTAIEESLRRLDTDYVDLYQLHVPDPTVPIADTLEALDNLISAGKVRAIGCSNLSVSQLEEAERIASEMGTARFVSIQARLNILSRDTLADIMPACHRLGIRFIPYFPLARGVLTGKYGRDRPTPTYARLFAYELGNDPERTPAGYETRDQVLTERTFDRLEALETYAAQRGHSLVELAFAWLLAFPPVATVIAGVARPGQAISNASSGDWQLTPEEVDEVVALAEL